MTSIKTHLLRDNSIFVGEKEKSLNLIHSFYISEGLSDLERFLQQNSAEARYFNQAFAYWVLCALGRCKEDIKRYGILTRKLINFSKKTLESSSEFVEKKWQSRYETIKMYINRINLCKRIRQQRFSLFTKSHFQIALP